MKRYRSVILLLLVGVILADAAPLRVDINADERSDMRTLGWENWRPSGGDWSQTFGEVTAILRASSDAGTLSLKGNKAILIHGVTLGADGAVVSGSEPAEIEIQLDGLSPGPHTFVGSTAAGRDNLLQIGGLLILAAILHNGFGYVFGYSLALLAKLDTASARTVAFEVGLQNGGVASGIAGALGKLGTMGLASAVFSPWMNLSGSVLANWWRGRVSNEVHE